MYNSTAGNPGKRRNIRSFSARTHTHAHRCGCKHKHTDHDPITGKCMKLVGKHKKPCECKEYHVTWNCNCGHSWKDHVTMFVFKEYSSMARDWVCSGVSEAVREEAEWKRQRAAKKNCIESLFCGDATSDCGIHREDGAIDGSFGSSGGICHERDYRETQWVDGETKRS